MNKIYIENEKDLKANAAKIIRRINTADCGGLLFLLNPILALDEAGVQLTPRMNRHIRTGLKYGVEDKRKIKKLEIQIARVAKESVDVESNAEVSRLLFEKLKVTPLSSAVLSRIKTAPVSATYERDEDESPEIRSVGAAESHLKNMSIVELKNALRAKRLPVSGNKTELIRRIAKLQPVKAATPLKMSTEVLEKMRSKHPVIPKLLALRKLYDESGWQFVNREVFMQVKGGMSVSLVRQVRFKSESQPQTGRPATRKPKAVRKSKTRIGSESRERFKKLGSISQAANARTS